MAESDFHSVAAQGIKVTLDLRVGHIRDLVIERDGRVLRPLHVAPWVEDPSIREDESIAPSLRLLAGDFFCAPFGPSDVEPAPGHGWTANSRWDHVETVSVPGGTASRYRLERKVMGATVDKVFTLLDGHSFLYETHRFTGGSGSLPVSNHAMLRFPAGGRLSFSAKAYSETPMGPLESDPMQGRSRLAYDRRSTDLTRLPMANGGFADITRYPFAERHEDLVVLVEASNNRLGWAAAQRPDSRDLYLSLKSPADLPVTILWFSNGGRDYPPWNGRHVGVLGIEEGRVYSIYGHKAAIEPNPLSASGVPTSLTLRAGGRVEIRNVIGSLPMRESAPQVAEISAGDGHLALRFEDDTRLEVPFDTTFLEPQLG